MSDRDLLADMLSDCLHDGTAPAWTAETLLTRGIRLPAREITTAAELDALPVGSIVADREGDPWKALSIHGARRWRGPFLGNYETGRFVDDWGPVTVLYVPTEEADRGV
ncbi:hypothetical protein [Nocardia ignorata]|uniref:Uncharacterized protein n=1 Tax=Nocardia ignorata TaxID=145285 RepID=A0A4R6NYY8_NOCIG|nr:hypothetical protein [Nocardia ignorata]TDP29839.1 hypothetical protein DFR75_112108 [Nocardia ignorata]